MFVKVLMLRTCGVDGKHHMCERWGVKRKKHSNDMNSSFLACI